MDNLYPLLRSVAIFFLLVILIRVLYSRGVFTDKHSPVFGKLITEFILPVTIFSTLAVSKIDFHHLYAAGVFLGALIITCTIAYFICRFLHFSNKITGTIVTLSGFGRTSTLAYSLLTQAYEGNTQAIATTFIIGEFGSCIPFFTIGVIILAYFGRGESEMDKGVFSVIKAFFYTPIFLSLAFGLLASQITPVSDLFSSDFFSYFFDYFNNAFEMLVAITVGLMLRPIKVRDIILYATITLSLSLILTPLLVYSGSFLINADQITTEILVIMASVPSGAVAAVMSERYGCDGSLASAIVVLSFLSSLVMLPLMTVLLLS